MTKTEAIAYARTFIGTKGPHGVCVECGAPVPGNRRRFCADRCMLAAELRSQAVRQRRLAHARPRPRCVRCGAACALRYRIYCGGFCAGEAKVDYDARRYRARQLAHAT